MDKESVLLQMNAMNKGTLMETLNIEYTDVGDGFVEGFMPVNKTTHQPMGLLHGGATAALAETLGSCGSAFLIDREKEYAVGVEINANHLKGVNSGNVIGKAKIEHKGRKMHVWSIEVFDENKNKVAICRLTNLIIQKK